MMNNNDKALPIKALNLVISNLMRMALPLNFLNNLGILNNGLMEYRFLIFHYPGFRLTQDRLSFFDFLRGVYQTVEPVFGFQGIRLPRCENLPTNDPGDFALPVKAVNPSPF